MKKIFLIIILIGGAVGIWFGYNVFAPNDFKEQETIKIEPGITAQKIAVALKDKKIISSELAFIWYARLTGADNKLVAGLHQLEPRSSIKQILRQLETRNTSNEEKEVTIIEGWKLSDIGKYLADSGIMSILEKIC